MPTKRWLRMAPGSTLVAALALGCGSNGGSAPTQPAGPAITGVTVTPSAPTVTIGETLQLTATVSGTGAFNPDVTWAAAGPSGWAGGVGTISNSGLYVTPYPAPPSVTITATAAGADRGCGEPDTAD